MNSNENEKLVQGITEEDFDFDELEKELEKGLEESVDELSFMEEEKKKIGNPESIGNAVMNVVWDQFIFQIGAVAGEDFIKENGGMTLDLSDEAHIQTPENFAEGKIATHNNISREQLEKNYDRYKNMPHGEFRDKHVDPQMDKVLPRAGELNKKGVDTVRDIYNSKK